MADHRSTLVRRAREVKQPGTDIGSARASAAPWLEELLERIATGERSITLDVLEHSDRKYREDKPGALAIKETDESELREVLAHHHQLARYATTAGLDSALGEGKSNRQGRLERLSEVRNRELELLNGWGNRGDVLYKVLQGAPSELDRLILGLRWYYWDLALAETEAVPAQFALALALLVFVAVVAVVLPLLQLSAHSEDDKLSYVALFAAGLAGFALFIIYLLNDNARLIRISSRDPEINY
jgi:hypothetical protein